MAKSKKSAGNDLKWQIAIKDVQHKEGKYPVYEWSYGTDKAVAFVVQAWPQGYLLFKESREGPDDAFKTGNVEELFIWMRRVKNWKVMPPRIREVWGVYSEAINLFGKMEHPKTEEFFKFLLEKLKKFSPEA